MPIDELLDEAFGVEKPKMVEVAIKRTAHEIKNDMELDFSYLTNNSSFQRSIIEFIKKYIPGYENLKHRGSKQVMRQSFNENAHNARNYRLVINELEEKLKERKNGK